MSSVPSVGTREVAAPRRVFWRAAGAAGLAALALLALAAVLSSGLGLVDMARWAAAQQRAFHEMVQGLLGTGQGGLWASLGLVTACFVYGFAHAAIPGHGKFIIAGAGFASRMSAARLVALAVAASFAQAVTAVVLVYGSFLVLDITAGWAMTATDRVLVPLSNLAILLIGVILLRRAWVGLAAYGGSLSARLGLGPPQHHHHEGDCHDGCGHRHGPTAEEAEAVRSWRDAAMLIAGIGIRPCTGAIFVLVAAWRIGLPEVGVGATLAMAIGTGAFTSLVAVSTVTARGATLFAAGMRNAGLAVPLLQFAAGVSIVLVSVAFLVVDVLRL